MRNLERAIDAVLVGFAEDLEQWRAAEIEMLRARERYLE